MQKSRTLLSPVAKIFLIGLERSVISYTSIQARYVRNKEEFPVMISF